MYSKQHINIIVGCIHNVEAGVKKLFFQILNDYCIRFNVIIVRKKPTVVICFTDYHEEDPKSGTTIDATEYNKIFVQIRDPFLANWEDNPYMKAEFLNTTCHEIVHVCQSLTGRKGFKIKGAVFDPAIESESYYFDPEEVEARALADFYRDRYGNALI